MPRKIVNKNSGRIGERVSETEVRQTLGVPGVMPHHGRVCSRVRVPRGSGVNRSRSSPWLPELCLAWQRVPWRAMDSLNFAPVHITHMPRSAAPCVPNCEDGKRRPVILPRTGCAHLTSSCHDKTTDVVQSFVTGPSRRQVLPAVHDCPGPYNS